MPTPAMKKLQDALAKNHKVRLKTEGIMTRSRSYPTTTTGKGGVVTRQTYPAIIKASATTRVMARPNLSANVLTMKAAPANPRAWDTKMVETMA